VDRDERHDDGGAWVGKAALLAYAMLRPRIVLVAVGFGATLFFAYLAVRHVDLAAAWESFRTSRHEWLLPAFALLALAVFIRCVRWRYLFPKASRPSLGAIVSTYLIAQFFNSILPLRAGEAARVVELKRRKGTSRAETTSTVVLERVFDVIGLLVLLFVLLPWLPQVKWVHAAVIVAIVAVVGFLLTATALGVYGDAPIRLLVLPLRLMPWFTSERRALLAGNLARGLAGARGISVIVLTFVLTQLSWIVMGFSFWLLSLAFDLPRTPLLGMLVVISTNLAQILPSAPGAIGVFEAAVLVATTAYGAPRSVGLSYAVLLHVMNFLPYLALGPVLLGRSRTSVVEPLDPAEPRGDMAS
jgi:glycosyltransferase 2 family protein